MKKLSLPLVFAAALGCSVPESALSAPPQAAVSTKWLAVPSADNFERYYPVAASRQEVGGKAVLNCTLDAVGVPTGCVVTQEDPQGMGFGDAALKLSRFFRAASKVGGKSTEGTPVRIPIIFRQPEL